MKISDIFRRARIAVAARTGEYICLAIRHDIHICRKDKERALDVIRERMGGRINRSDNLPCSLETWLTSNGHASYKDVLDLRVMKTYRLRWLDALIAEFEAKGN